jgi:hypothetical protein
MCAVKTEAELLEQVSPIAHLSPSLPHATATLPGPNRRCEHRFQEDRRDEEREARLVPTALEASHQLHQDRLPCREL